MTDLDVAAEAAYTAGMDLRPDKTQMMHPYATLPEYWKRIYRAQAAAILALTDTRQQQSFNLEGIA